MRDDPKLDFYLNNRALIEEWAKLRESAAIALDRELLAAAERLTEADGVPLREIREEAARSVRLEVTTAPLTNVWLELWWQKGRLLTGSGGWPQLVIVMEPRPPLVRDAVKNATGLGRVAHGMISTGPGSWVRFGEIPPKLEPIVIQDYAEHCVQRLRVAWLALEATIRKAVENATASS